MTLNFRLILHWIRLKMYNYFELRYNEEEGLSLFKGIVDDVDFLMPEVVKIYREKESKR